MDPISSFATTGTPKNLVKIGKLPIAFAYVQRDQQEVKIIRQKRRITVHTNDVNMQCLTSRSQYTHITTQPCCLRRLFALRVVDTGLSQQTPLMDVSVSCCNLGHIFHGDKFNIKRGQ